VPGAALAVARRTWKGALVAALAFAAAGVAGCGQGADTERGQALFLESCGVCHTLAEAGTTSDRAPDLDASFADARASGMTDSTIESVVREQIANPRSIREGDPIQDQVTMPADIVTGQDADDVAAYVGSVAGVPGIEPPEADPPELFARSCGICHTLEAAGTQSTTGPDLDEVLPGQDAEQIRESIVNPDAQIAPGFAPGVMPNDFEQVLTEEEITGLVQFLLRNVGQGGQGGQTGQG
jgi:mono/diheme cytochrome c family protein